MEERRYFSKEVTLTLKGIAVILMLMHHLFCCFPEFVEKYQVNSILLPMEKVMVLSFHSKICVAVFVFLSAYGMTVSMQPYRAEPDTARVLRRFWKLESGFLIVYLCSILTSFLREDGLQVYMRYGWLKGFLYMVIDAAGLADLFGSPTYNETWWYMTLAILLIFVLPMFVELYRKFGICAVVAAAMFSYLFEIKALMTYLFAAFLGIYMANSSCYARISRFSLRRKVLILIASACGCAFACLLRLKLGYAYQVDAAAAASATIALFILIDLFQLRIFRPLAFVGRHSMNIFLVHTLLLEYYFTDFVYSPGNWLLITGLLLLMSLAVSLVIEQLKHLLGKVRIRLCSAGQA